MTKVIKNVQHLCFQQKDGEVTVYDNKLLVIDRVGLYVVLQVNHCPFCGDLLYVLDDDEEVQELVEEDSPASKLGTVYGEIAKALTSFSNEFAKAFIKAKS